MNSYRRNNWRGTRSSFYGAAALIGAIALLFAVDHFSGGLIRDIARTSAGGVRSLVASVETSVADSGFFSTRAGLARENETLRQEIALHAEEIALAEFVRDENNALQELVRLAEGDAGISARVLSSFSSAPYGTFLIGAGSRDGVQEGSIVLTPGGFVLGVVKSVSARSATVEALFAPSTETDMIVNDVAFRAEGHGGGNARAEVAREAAVAVGDTVTAPEYGGRAAGMIMHLESASSSATAVLSIRIPVNLDALRFVYVVTR